MSAATARDENKTSKQKHHRFENTGFFLGIFDVESLLARSRFSKQLSSQRAGTTLDPTLRPRTRAVTSSESPGLIYRSFLLKPCTGEGEWSNIFANPPAKWLPPLNIVEYPGVTGATCCHIIPLCLKSHHSKSGTPPGKVVLKGGGGRLPRTEVECSPGTRTGRRSLKGEALQLLLGCLVKALQRADCHGWSSISSLQLTSLSCAYQLCFAQLLSEAWMLLFREAPTAISSIRLK